MRRYLLFFVCILAFASCAALRYDAAQEAKTVSIDSSADSASYRRMIDQIVHDELQNRLDIQEWVEQTTVTETLSAPDSTGAQHVTQRRTTTLSKRKQTSAEIAQTTEEKYQEQLDSTRQQATVSYLEKEEEKVVKAKKENSIPWYVYIVALVGAALVGLYLCRHKGRISI